MKKLKNLSAGVGVTGILLAGACCVLPFVGIALGVGSLSFISGYLEWAGVGAIVLSLIFITIYFNRNKSSSATSSGEDCCTNQDNTFKNRPIACDLDVFTEEEKVRHEKNSIRVIQSAIKVKPLPDGYAFVHPYTQDTFLAIAEWVTNENKCCPFFVFEIAIEPLENDHEIWLKLRGDIKIKQYLEANKETLGLDWAIEH